MSIVRKNSKTSDLFGNEFWNDGLENFNINIKKFIYTNKVLLWNI
jgi:hypothetical protein